MHSKLRHANANTKFCNENFCNSATDRPALPTLAPVPSSTPLPISQQLEISIYYQLIIFLFVASTFSLVFILIFYIIMLSKQKRAKSLKPCEHGSLSPANELIDATSGSGSGAPLFVHRTIAREIVKTEKIAEGRFGKVWLAKWRDRNVAVKEFLTHDEASWECEKSFYQTASIRHPNILGYITAYVGNLSGDTPTMQIITEYHKPGNLCDYLSKHYLTPFMLHRLASTLMAGLDHLHLEITGNPIKPGIAHRDIKSRNILITENGECVLADFGMAVNYYAVKNNDEIKVQVGTRRYMAPEILDNTLNAKQFDAFKSADVYSIGLVLWEMCRRCITMVDLDGQFTCDNYSQPYEDCVPTDPNIEDMYNAVVIRQMRPTIPERWKNVEILRVLSQVIQECWRSKPSARLTAVRIKKTLNNMQQNVAPSDNFREYVQHLPVTSLIENNFKACE